MSEILNACFKSPQALTQSKHYHLLERQDMAKYRWELYPLVNEYYHEFNPFFVHAIPDIHANVYPAFKIFTVRDGYIGFADFLLKYWRDIPNWGNTFLIPPSYAPLVPQSLQSHFLTYTTSQVKTPDIHAAKTVTVFGILMDYYFGNYDQIEKKLQQICDLPQDVKVEVCLSMRRNPFLTSERENFHWIRIPELIRKYLGDRDITWVRMADFMQRSALKKNFLIDLKIDDSLTCDSYLHFWYLERGGMIGNFPVWDPKQETLFDIDLNFGQKLQVHAFPKVKDQFADLLYFAKTNRGERWNLSAFYNVVRKIVNPAGLADMKRESGF